MRSIDPQPVELIEIATGVTSDPLIRLTSDEADYVWPTGGNTFTARPFEMDPSSLDPGSFEAVQFRAANADGYWDTWFLSTTFRFQKIRRFIIERDSTATSAHAICDAYRILHHEEVDREVVFTARPLMGVLSEINLPRGVMTRDDFPSIPRQGVIQ